MDSLKLFVPLLISIFAQVHGQSECEQLEVTSSELDLSVTPSVVDGLFKQERNLTCSFTPNHQSDFSQTSSMVLSKRTPGLDTNFQNIASITSISRNFTGTHLGAEVVGQLSRNGRAFISVRSLDATLGAGEYKCLVLGMRSNTCPLSVTSTAILETDTYVLLQKYKELLDARELQQTQINRQIAALDFMKNHQYKMMFLLNNSHHALHFATTSYRNHTYMLSKPMVMNIATAESHCYLMGGYVAEINDLQEYQFVENFVYNTSGLTRYEHIHLGASQNSAGQWVYRHSGTPAFDKWSGNQGTDGDCQYFWQKDADGLYSHTCYDLIMARFLCEIHSWGIFEHIKH